MKSFDIKNKAAVEVIVFARHFLSNPDVPFADMGVKEIQFRYRAVDFGQAKPYMFTSSEPIRAEGGMAFKATLYMEPGETFEINTRILSLDGTVSDGEAHTLEVTQDATFYMLEYRILEMPGGAGANEVPIEGAQFVLNPGSGSERTATSRPDGKVYMYTVPEGTHTFEISKAGYLTRAGEIKVPSAEQRGIHYMEAD